MSYTDGLVSKEFLDDILAENIIEEVQAGLSTVGGAVTTPQKVAEGTVEAGYDAVVMGIAVEQLDKVIVWLKRKDKQVFANGLQAAGMAGLAAETLVYVKLDEKNAWELGLTNTTGGGLDIGWRIRIRKLVKK